jgi:polyribonucleotide nucleotidyltransferase
MKLSKFVAPFRIIAFAVTSLFFLVCANATAEEMPESEYRELSDGQRYTGTVDSIHTEQALIIIDDRSFILDRVMQFNNASWSREQVMNQLKPNSRIEIEVGEIADAGRSVRLVTQIRTLDK